MIRYIYYLAIIPGIILNGLALFINIDPAFTNFETVMILLGVAIVEYLEEFRKNQVD